MTHRIRQAQSLCLLPRDHHVIELVYRYDGASVAIIHERLCPWGSSSIPCYRRSALLVDHGYLAATRLASLSGVGSGKRFLTLGAKGRELLAELYGVPLAQIQPRKITSTLLGEHHFLICRLRASLERICEETPGLELLEWTTERALRRRPMRVVDPLPGAPQRTISLIADAACAVESHGKHQSFWLEADMAQVSAGRLQTKLRGYLRLQQSQSPATPVLYVTTTQARARHILFHAASQAKKLHARARGIFVTTVEQVCCETVLHQPIWQQPGVSTPIGLLSQVASADQVSA